MRSCSAELRIPDSLTNPGAPYAPSTAPRSGGAGAPCPAAGHGRTTVTTWVPGRLERNAPANASAARVRPAQPTAPGARGRRDTGSATSTALEPASSTTAAARSRSALVGTSSITRPRTGRPPAAPASRSREAAGVIRSSGFQCGPPCRARGCRATSGSEERSAGRRARGVFSASVRTRSPSAPTAPAGSGSAGIASHRASSRTSRPSASSTTLRVVTGAYACAAGSRR